MLSLLVCVILKNSIGEVSSSCCLAFCLKKCRMHITIVYCVWQKYELYGEIQNTYYMFPVSNIASRSSGMELFHSFSVLSIFYTHSLCSVHAFYLSRSEKCKNSVAVIERNKIYVPGTSHQTICSPVLASFSLLHDLASSDMLAPLWDFLFLANTPS